MDESTAGASRIGVSMEGLAGQVGDLRAVIDAQAKMIDALQHEVARMKIAGATTAFADDEKSTVEPSGLADLSAPTSRRSLMGKGAAAAAGAAIAGTVLNVASAPPAAAAPGVFDGNPAVSATASPTSGDGVRGDTDSGNGVIGTAIAGTGVFGLATGTEPNRGVYGASDSGNGTGVYGEAAATSGPTKGVSGFVASTSGAAVVGEAGAGAGNTFGVYGSSASTDGVGVQGDAFAGSGPTIGVKGVSTSPSGYGMWGVNPATGGTGVHGEASATSGVTSGVKGLASSGSGTGVVGEASAVSGVAIGVKGTSASSSGAGVQGIAEATAGNTVGVSGIAVSSSGRGVLGSGGLVGVTAGSTRTQLQLTGTPVAPLSAGLGRTAGEVVFDSNKDLWLCVVSGTPGTWRRLSGPSTAGAFVPLPAPVRVYDSRVGFNPNIGPKTKLVPATPRTVDCTLNSSGVPVGASGVLVNLVSTGTSAFGDMAIYKDGIPYPGTSNLNFFGFTVAVTTFSAVSASAKVAVRSNVACDVVLDVLGYYQ